MIKRRNNIVSDSLENYDLKETSLSIQISLDGFSFCIYHPSIEKYLALVCYEFDAKLNSAEALLTPVEAIFEENILLQQKYKEVNVCHANELATIVPTDYFDENNLSSYLEKNIKVLKTDFIAFDQLKTIPAVSVFIPFVNINNFLFTQFGSFDFNHISNILLDKLSLLSKKKDTEQVYIHVNSSNFELMLFNKGELIFYNSFSFQTAEDFIYYILFSFEQLKLNTETIDTVLFGEIEKDSELYKIAYQYIRILNFFNSVNPKLTEEFEMVSKHAFYTQLNQH